MGWIDRGRVSGFGYVFQPSTTLHYPTLYPVLTLIAGIAAVVWTTPILVGAYVALRRWLADIAPTVFAYVPDQFQQYVPERYQPGTEPKN